MKRTIRFSAIAAMTSLLSVAILMTAAHFDVAQAQKGRAAAIACGQELQKLCTGVMIFANNTLECLKRDQSKLSPRCAALANNIVRACLIETLHSVALATCLVKAVLSDA